MKDYQNKLDAFANKLKTEPAPVPLQKIEPIVVPEVNLDPDVQFNTEIPKSLRKKLKAYSNENDLSLKDITINALKFYLQNHAENQEKTTQ